MILDESRINEIKSLSGSGENSLLAEMIESFLVEAPKAMIEIKESIKKSEPLRLRKAAHKLRGACLNLGAADLASCCQSLEAKGKAENLMETEPLLAELETSCAVTSSELTKVRRSIK